MRAGTGTLRSRSLLVDKRSIVQRGAKGIVLGRILWTGRLRCNIRLRKYLNLTVLEAPPNASVVHWNPVKAGFAGGRAGHHLINGLMRRSTLVEDGVYLLGDGHFDVQFAGKPDSGIGGKNAFRDHPVHTLHNLLQLAAASQFDSNGTIA